LIDIISGGSIDISMKPQQMPVDFEKVIWFILHRLRSDSRYTVPLSLRSQIFKESVRTILQKLEASIAFPLLIKLSDKLPAFEEFKLPPEVTLEVKASSDLVAKYTDAGASDSEESDVMASAQNESVALAANPEHHKYVLKIQERVRQIKQVYKHVGIGDEISNKSNSVKEAKRKSIKSTKSKKTTKSRSLNKKVKKKKISRR
jgi:hypothetical protein